MIYLMDLPICRDECPIQEIKPIQLLGMRLLGMRLFWIDNAGLALDFIVRTSWCSSKRTFGVNLAR
jgi:hypothetical protein